MRFYIVNADLMFIFSLYVNLGRKNFLISFVLERFALVNRD